MFDVVIIGSGLGGLLCGNFLSREGMRVCVLEKNRQTGGNLQTFARDKQVFDTGVHYIGGLDKGQTLYQIFQYAGILDKLKMQKMDERFDGILIENDEKTYWISQGYDAFIRNLTIDFPDEQLAIENYCRTIQETCKHFPLYHLKPDSAPAEKFVAMGQNAREIIASFTENQKLREVLAGNNLLYAGVGDKTPFHIHALIQNSYVESCWKLPEGGSQIARLLAASIRKAGGKVVTRTAVKKIVEKDGQVTHLETEQGESIHGRNFISNISPAATLNLISSPLLKETYRKRITELEQTVSSFSLYLVLKEKMVPYQNRNYYYHKEGRVWDQQDYTDDNWPLGYGLYFTEDRRHPGFASAVSVLALMKFGDVEAWTETHNRAGFEAHRGEDYEQFKQRKSEKLIKLMGGRFPEITSQIRSVYAATPLTNRDYIGMEGGPIYGIQKDFRDPLKTMISPRTRIPNLFLTGQNLNLHGILGTSLSAVQTSSVLLNDHSLIDKIRNA